jgi:hypothetical protein
MARSIRDHDSEKEEEEEVEDLEDLTGAADASLSSGSQTRSNGRGPSSHASSSRLPAQPSSGGSVIFAETSRPVSPERLAIDLFPDSEDWSQERVRGARLDKGKGRAKVEESDQEEEEALSDAPSGATFDSSSSLSLYPSLPASPQPQDHREDGADGRSARQNGSRYPLRNRPVVEIPLLPLGDLSEYSLSPVHEPPSRLSRRSLLLREDPGYVSSRSVTPVRVQPKRNAARPQKPTWRVSSPGGSDDILLLDSQGSEGYSGGEAEDEMSEDDDGSLGEEEESEDDVAMRRSKRGSFINRVSISSVPHHAPPSCDPVIISILHLSLSVLLVSYLRMWYIAGR